MEDVLNRAVGQLIDKQQYWIPYIQLTNFSTDKRIETIGIRWCKDKIDIICNPDFFNTLSILEQQEILIHEYAHLILKHLNGARILSMQGVFYSLFPGTDEGKAQRLLNFVEDMEINGAIARIDNLPKGCINAEDYKWEQGLLAEEYLKLLKDDEKAQKKIFEFCDDPLNKLGIKLEGGEEITEIEQEIIDGLHKEGVLKGDAPGDLERFLEKLNPPTINWRGRFKNQMLGALRTNTAIPSWARKSRRNKLSPGLIFKQKPNAYILFDVSGSMSEATIAAMGSEIFGLKRFFNKVKVIVCDVEITDVYDFKGKLKNITGGGGSDFQPAIELVESFKEKIAPHFILLTDGYINVTEKKPRCSTFTWVLNNKEASVPYGSTIHLKIK